MSFETLEFPNDTWAAQEIRKVNVLAIAAEYDSAHRERYRSSARRYLDFLTNRLQESDTRHFARIQILLMQNYGLQRRLDLPCRQAPVDQAQVRSFFSSGQPSFKSLVRSILAKLWVALRKFDWQREKRWFRHRRGLT